MINYIFPFDKVEKGSKIIIYGAGAIGNGYLEQINILNYCECLFFVDRNFEKIQVLHGIKVASIEEINDSEYDKVVIAAKDQSIYELLRQKEIPEEKIVHSIATQLLTSEARHLPDPSNSPFWDDYYQKAEKAAPGEFNHYLKPILSKYDDIDFSETLDFACGRGRMANVVSGLAKSITCCDINATAIEYCKVRFENSKDCTFHFQINNRVGSALEHLDFADDSFTFIYSWDAMVHFTYKWLDYYLKEFYRISKNNSYVMIHHSNYANVPTTVEEKSEDWLNNPHGRTNISKEDFRFLAEKHGFSVVEQQLIDWEIKDLDCISLLKVIKD
ncbi:class I SAM-dependent methyltransferase [Paenibacillus typhae]|uniref:class I SAM-dependent methyltransferase n=1 Tax=Paenibacillus typhae TaxID=1174501 RepID=UPI001C8EC9EC|nr:class I SAM-dependent methyltransferase [Paenibacillus typhae]MBY0009108.1 methyltransferase domain-containing protein [Paenibacillus typhae]